MAGLKKTMMQKTCCGVCFFIVYTNGGKEKGSLPEGAVRYSNKDFCPPPLTETKAKVKSLIPAGNYTLYPTLQNTYEHEIVPFKYGNFVSLHGCLFLIKIIRSNNQQNKE